MTLDTYPRLSDKALKILAACTEKFRTSQEIAADAGMAGTGLTAWVGAYDRETRAKWRGTVRSESYWALVDISEQGNAFTASLVDLGYVELRKDKRRVLIKITPKGRQALQASELGQKRITASNDNDKSLGGETTQQGGKPAPADERSLGDRSTFGGSEGSSVSDLGEFADLPDHDIEIMDLSSRYKIEESLGKGGMGEVLLATDTRLDRKVAIKRIRRDVGSSKAAVTRFLTEAKSIAALSHNNVVQIHDYGRDERGPFLIMEYVAGGSLLDRCKQGPIELEEAVDLACHLCDGLARAHDAGIVHRDIKPANILLTTDGIPKLTDFGLAKAESRDHTMTMAGAVLGTLDFMPPEQRQDASLVDERSDLWSLGATLYQMVTGKSPKIIRFDILPKALTKVLGQALDEDKTKRFGTAVQFGAALRASTKLLRMLQESQQDLGAGECPQCHTLNESSRKYCRECAGALRVSCLACNETLAIWDKVCGECGAKQPHLIQEQSKKYDKYCTEIDLHQSNNEHEEALDKLKLFEDIDDARFTSFQQWAVTTESKIRSDLARLLQESEDLFKESHQHRAVLDYKSAIACAKQIHSRHLTPEWQRHLECLEVDQKTARKILRHVRRLLKQQSFDDVDDLLASASEYLGEHKAVVELRRQSQAYKKIQKQVRKTAIAAASEQFSNKNYGDVASCFDELSPAFRTKAVDTWCDRASEALEKLKALETRIYNLNSVESLDARVRLADDYLQLSGSNEAILQVRKYMLDGRDLHSKSVAAREAGDYDSAITYMQQINDTIVSVAMQDFLKTLVAERDESQQLLSEIKDGIKARSFDGLLPKVLRAIELRGDREDLPKLKAQLLARQQKLEKLEKQRDVCYAEAAMLFKCGNAKSALSKIDSVKTLNLRESDKHLKSKLTDVVKAEQSLTRLVADCNEDGVSDPSAIGEMLSAVIAYLEMNPNHPAIKNLRQDLFGLIKKEPKSYAGFLTPSVLAKCPGPLLAVFPGPELTKVPPITNSIGMDLKLLPAGVFTMGDEGAEHEVRLTNPFMLGVYEVTQSQYERVMGNNPSRFNGDNNPVERVSWDDAVEFCRKLSALLSEKAAGRVYRLPTEAEWEYACRAGTTTEYSFGDDDSRLGDYAWFGGNSGDRTYPVGGKKPNAWGLYDMHGNVWEWCQDRYGAYPGHAITNPSGPNSGSDRVGRGGGWVSPVESCRSGSRRGEYPSLRYVNSGNFGFRVCLSPSGE